MSTEEMVNFYEKLINDHPALISIEDPLDEKDYEGWKLMTKTLGDKIMIVGDDLYTTNTRLIKFVSININNNGNLDKVLKRIGQMHCY